MQDQPQSQTMPEQSDDVEESDDGSVLHLVHLMMMLKMVKNKMATLVPMVSLMTVKNLMKMLTVRLATFLLMIPKKKKIPIPRQNQKEESGDIDLGSEINEPVVPLTWHSVRMRNV